MKKLIVLAAVVFSTASFAQAQTDKKTEPTPAAPATHQLNQATPAVSANPANNVKPANHNGEHKATHSDWTMKDGKMMHCMGDKLSPMTENVTLKNGTVISTKGEVTTTDGKKTMLANGQCVDRRGTVLTCDEIHAQAKEREQKHQSK